MKKLLSVITLLVLLVGSAFAENLIEYGSQEIDDGIIMYTLIDIDAREPYNAEEESIEYLLYLQQNYDNVVFKWEVEVTPENCPRICIDISKENKVYRTIRFCGSCVFEYLVCYDGTVIKYFYTRRNE